jgi:hypothetical protein
MTTTVDRAHLEFFDAAGFAPGTTRTKNIYMPAHAGASFIETTITASAAPFNAANEDRQLKVTDVSIRSLNPNAFTGNLPTVRVTVESVGPDSPLIWYLNLGVVEP